MACGVMPYGDAATDSCIQADNTTNQPVCVALGETKCFQCHLEGTAIEWMIDGVLYSRNVSGFAARNITHNTVSNNSTLQILGTCENNSTQIECCKQPDPDNDPTRCDPPPPVILLTICQG